MTIGPLKTGKTVRDATKATLQLWLPSVLAEVETAYDLDAGALPVPAAHAYHLAARADTLLPVTARPAFVIATPERTNSRRGDGTVDAVWSLLVTILAGGKSFADTIDNADFYAVAAEAVLTQHPTLAPYGEPSVARWVTATGVDYAPIGDGDRTVMRATVSFAVGVTGALDTSAGPLEPPPAEWPFPVDVVDTAITVERME